MPLPEAAEAVRQVRAVPSVLVLAPVLQSEEIQHRRTLAVDKTLALFKAETAGLSQSFEAADTSPASVRLGATARAAAKNRRSATMPKGSCGSGGENEGDETGWKACFHARGRRERESRERVGEERRPRKSDEERGKRRSEGNEKRNGRESHQRRRFARSVSSVSCCQQPYRRPSGVDDSATQHSDRRAQRTDLGVLGAQLTADRVLPTHPSTAEKRDRNS